MHPRKACPCQQASALGSIGRWQGRASQKRCQKPDSPFHVTNALTAPACTKTLSLWLGCQAMAQHVAVSALATQQVMKAWQPYPY